MSYDRLNSVSLGVGAASTLQGSAAIAIGYKAGAESQPPSSIVINASGQALSGVSTNALYIAPVRNASGPSIMMYDTLTKEAVQGTTFGGTLMVSTLLGSTMSTSTMNITALTVSSINNVAISSIINGGGENPTLPTLFLFSLFLLIIYHLLLFLSLIIIEIKN